MKGLVGSKIGQSVLFILNALIFLIYQRELLLSERTEMSQGGQISATLIAVWLLVIVIANKQTAGPLFVSTIAFANLILKLKNHSGLPGGTAAGILPSFAIVFFRKYIGHR